MTGKTADFSRRYFSTHIQHKLCRVIAAEVLLQGGFTRYCLDKLERNAGPLKLRPGVFTQARRVFQFDDEYIQRPLPLNKDVIEQVFLDKAVAVDALQVAARDPEALFATVDDMVRQYAAVRMFQ